ncbi:TonB-dependent receptor [Phenylobacterium sp.]|jgi:outer membrane receptor protein involved in Fe transport|uniref:TonB-dependent receptor n=1 Tax=Phenylobacterium sp. TaxID=1871053 RepID=UPI002E2EBA74|nr:TonB-dependent receptor [Phenylobacterium sp.]HEX2559823.1 TonB-dependent receptor [Phenylobacterium sp.]
MKTRLKPCLLAAASSLTLGSAALAQTASTTLDEVIVTAQKREESIQDVPIAVSAFSESALQDQRIDGGYNLQIAVPNLSFTRGGNGTPNFQIRGVGYQLVSTSGDAGVLVHENNAPLVVSRIADAEFYDMERLEVLRGPQGTLYGRNATGGVVNIITAKPVLGDWNGSISGELGNFNTRRSKGHVNVPLGEQFAFRLAGAYLQRDGYTDNIVTGNDIDSRDLWSVRATLAFEPNERFRAWLMWEHFDEDDSRNSGAKTLCINDPGPAQVGTTPVTNAAARNFLSPGCQRGTIFQPAALGNPNSVATFGGLFATLAGLTTGDTFAGTFNDPDLRKVSFYADPTYQAENDTWIGNAEFDVTEALTLSFLASFVTDTSFTTGGSQEALTRFNVTPVTPGGVYNDPQGGPGSGVRTLSYADNKAEQWTTEVRLQSDFDGALNFNIGAFLLELDRENVTFVSTNATNAYRQLVNNPGLGFFDATPGIPVSGLGHNYYFSYNPYRLSSSAYFGEVYWQALETVRVTAGLRRTKDVKDRENFPILLFQPNGAGGPGTGGWAPGTIIPQTVEFEETTGRFVVDWQPDLGFTDHTLIYASYSRGYKAGGFNSPILNGTSPPYAPEIVSAYEIGTKNILLDQALQVNLTAFYYDYKDFQFSRIDGLTASTSNVDVVVKGAEFEGQWRPTEALRLNANVGYLSTEVQEGSSINAFDRTQGDPSLTYFKSISAGCVVSTAALERLIADINAGRVPATAVSGAGGVCNGGGVAAAYGLNPKPGVAVNLAGKELPNSPHWTMSLGAQYTWDLADWQVVLRGDYYRQTKAYGSIFNGVDFEIPEWDNANLSLILRQPAWGVEVQLYAKNIADEDVVINYDVGSEQLGLTRGVQLLEPRLFGVAVTKRW